MSTTMRSVQLPLTDDVRNRWRRLEEACEQPSVFRTPEWVEAWAEAMGLVDDTAVYIWHCDGEMMAALPVTGTRERLHPRVPVSVPVSITAGSGIGAGDHTGWSATGNGSDHVARWLRETRGAFLLKSLDPQYAAHLRKAGTLLEEERCPRLDLTQANGLSGSFAKRVAYYRRRAVREGCFLSVTPPGEVTTEQLSLLSSLHAQRFGASSVLSHRAVAIQESFRRRQRSDIGPVVVTASIDQRPVGVLWGLWFAGVFAYYQSGWCPEYRALNLGTVLVDHAISAALDMGTRTFDFLRGAEEYKYKFGATDRTDSTMLISRGVSGTVLRLKARTKAAVSDDPWMNDS